MKELLGPVYMLLSGATVCSLSCLCHVIVPKLLVQFDYHSIVWQGAEDCEH